MRHSTELKSIIVESYVYITREKVTFVEEYSYVPRYSLFRTAEVRQTLDESTTFLKVRESWLSCSHLCHYKVYLYSFLTRIYLHILKFHRQIHITWIWNKDFKTDFTKPKLRYQLTIILKLSVTKTEVILLLLKKFFVPRWIALLWKFRYFVPKVVAIFIHLVNE